MKIDPFRIEIPAILLDDLAHRLEYGAHLGSMKELAEY